jgi:hypothetical protein
LKKDPLLSVLSVNTIPIYYSKNQGKCKEPYIKKNKTGHKKPALIFIFDKKL